MVLKLLALPQNSGRPNHLHASAVCNFKVAAVDKHPKLSSWMLQSNLFQKCGRPNRLDGPDDTPSDFDYFMGNI